MSLHAEAVEAIRDNQSLHFDHMVPDAVKKNVENAGHDAAVLRRTLHGMSFA